MSEQPATQQPAVSRPERRASARLLSIQPREAATNAVQLGLLYDTVTGADQAVLRDRVSRGRLDVGLDGDDHRDLAPALWTFGAFVGGPIALSVPLDPALLTPGAHVPAFLITLWAISGGFAVLIGPWVAIRARCNWRSPGRLSTGYGHFVRWYEFDKACRSYREMKLAAVAWELAQRLNTHPAMSTPEMTTMSRRLQPNEYALEVSRRAVAIAIARRDLGPRPATRSQMWTAAYNRLDRMTDDLADSILPLTDLLTELDKLRHEQQHLDSIERTKALTSRLDRLEGNADQAATPSTANHDAVTDDIARLTAHIHTIADELELLAQPDRTLTIEH